MRKKRLASVLALGCAAFIVSGCSKNAEGDIIQPSKTTGKKNAYGWEMPKKTLNLTFFYALQGNPDERRKYDGAMQAYLLEKFNVNLEIIQYDTDLNERINLMLASNHYPESIYYLDAVTAKKFSGLGKAIELTPYIETTTELKKRYENYMPLITEDDGSVYRLIVQCGKGDLDKTILCADVSPMLREDWYQEIGSPDVSTPQKYFDAVKAMAEKHPENEAGKKTYGLSFYDTKGGSNIIPPFVSWWGGMFGLRQGWDWGGDGKTLTLWVNHEQGEKLVKYMNQFHREGLLDPDGLVMPIEQWGEKGIEQRYAAYIGPWFQPGFYISDHWYKLMGDDYEPLMRYTHYNVKDVGIPQSTFNPQSSASDSFVILTDKCKNPADYMRWFEFEQTMLGVKLMGYGIPNAEDSIWTFDEFNGDYSFIQEKADQITADIPSFDFDPYMALGGECQLMITGTTEKLEDGTNCWFNQSNKDKWKELKDENMKDSFYISTPYSTITMNPNDPLMDVRQRCADIITTGFAAAVTAPTEEECTAIFHKMRDDANAAGLRDVEQFYTEEFRKNLEKMGS